MFTLLVAGSNPPNLLAPTQLAPRRRETGGVFCFGGSALAFYGMSYPPATKHPPANHSPVI